MRIQPQEGISLRFVVKVPGDHLKVGNVLMNMSYADTFGKSLSEAYERLLLDCMRGDATLFARRDEVEASVAFRDPHLEGLEKDSGAATDVRGGQHRAAKRPTRSSKRTERSFTKF